MEEDMKDDVLCNGCSTILLEPYIHCMQCLPSSIYLCLHCFAKGVEIWNHESNHSYTVIRNDFPLFENRWSAIEEINLLKAIEEFGYGNWKEISEQVKSKTCVECERHYNKYYINNPVETLPDFMEPEISVFPSPIVFKLCEDPPRPAEGSSLYSDMGGYCAARGDFTVEYDNYSELNISHIDDTDDENTSEEDADLSRELLFAAIDIYNASLKERDRRKKIIRDYGVISIPKTYYCNKRFDRTIRPWVDGLRVFCTLFNPIEYDQYLESLHYERELKLDIEKLNDYRRNGITELRNIRLYKNLKRRREITLSRRHLLSDLLHHVQDEDACKTWLHKQAVATGTISRVTHVPLPTLSRKTPAPLDITGYPGCDKLNSAEKEVCAAIRLVPEAFMEFKKSLIKECQKMGGLKLAQARTLIKIDVNKTRKLYDHLMSEGVINKG